MPSDTRQAILREARRLFAERGFEATSVADIQAACGLRPGSGALYKHFASKRELLDAVLAEVASPVLPADLEAVGRHLLAADALSRPELALAVWLRRAVRDGRLRDHDCDAVAVLLAGALAHRRAAAALLGQASPGRDGEERLLEAWLDLALTALDPRRDLLD